MNLFILALLVIISSILVMSVLTNQNHGNRRFYPVPALQQGDLIVGGPNNKPQTLPIGSAHQVLTSNGMTPFWANPTGGTPGFLNPMTTFGDLIYGETGGVATRFGLGLPGQLLSSSLTGPSWVNAASSTNPLTQFGSLIYGGTGGTQTELLAGQTGQYLQYTSTGPSWTNMPKLSHVYTVTIDAPTIQGCIDLCVIDLSLVSTFVIIIPPGEYFENLVLKGNVNLLGLDTPMDSLGIYIYGHHTFNAVGANQLFNRFNLANIHFVNNTTTGPVLYISASNLESTEVVISGCFLENRDPSLLTELITLNHTDSGGPQQGSTIYLNNSKLRMASGAGQGGTHLTIRGGGSMYLDYGVDCSNGTRAFNIQGGLQRFAFVQCTACRFEITSSTSEIATIDSLNRSANITSLGCYWSNLANGGSGINLVNAAQSSMTSTSDVYQISPNLNGAFYTVKGAAGAKFNQAHNSYRVNGNIQNTIVLSTFQDTLTAIP